LHIDTREEIIYAVQRNFGGSFGSFKPATVFLSSVYPDVNEEMFKPAKDLVTEAIKQGPAL